MRERVDAGRLGHSSRLDQAGPGDLVPDEVPEDLARDHEPLDLARALVDLGDLRVAVVALDRELLRVAVAAEDLDRLRGLAPRHLGREQLRLRALLGVRRAGRLQPRRPIDEQARGVDLGRHVGELPLDRLEVRDALTERVALLRVLARDVVGRLRDAERLRGDTDPAAVERRHRDGEALVLLVQEAVALDVRALDDDVVRRRRVETELLLVARHANVIGVEDEGGHASRAVGRFVGAGEEKKGAGVAAVRDPLLARR